MKRSVVFLELNEAEKYFIAKGIAADKLPSLKRMFREGASLTTNISDWEPAGERAWRGIMPWMIWPSVYTGMTPAEHDIIAFGQDTSSIQGRCLWDVLDRGGISTGVCGSLRSYPPRSAGSACFYIPEALADDAECFPEDARPVQEFCIFTARNYSESFLSTAFTATQMLLRSARSGVRPGTMLRILGQPLREKLQGAAVFPERALLQSKVQMDAFRHLYSRYHPQFATLHMNHVAYMQHRYWRATEPERFKDELSPIDRQWFETVEDRKANEAKFSHWIERSLVYTDGLMAELMKLVDDETIVVMASALGQRPYDPVGEIHNPAARLIDENGLFGAIGVDGFEALTQMNPDLTLNFPSEERASLAAGLISGLRVHDVLFWVERRGCQVFLELNVPCPRGHDALPPIRHPDYPDLAAAVSDHITMPVATDQSTAQHRDEGFLVAWSSGTRLETTRTQIPVTDIAPMILSWYGLEPAAWMHPSNGPAIRVCSG